MREVFADTYYFLALLNSADPAHPRARALVTGLKSTVVTTEWVLTELADALSGPENRSECVEFVDDLRGSAAVQVVEFSAELAAAGWELYRGRPDKGWSLTDCVSFVVMERRGIREALTADRHFEQAGFVVLMR